MTKQIVVSIEIRTHSMQHSSVVLNRSVLLRRLGPSFSPEAGAPFLLALAEAPRTDRSTSLEAAGTFNWLNLQGMISVMPG